MQVTTAQALALFVCASFLTRTKYHALYVSWHEHHEELHGQRFVTLVESGPRIEGVLAAAAVYKLAASRRAEPSWALVGSSSKF